MPSKGEEQFLFGAMTRHPTRLSEAFESRDNGLIVGSHLAQTQQDQQEIPPVILNTISYTIQTISDQYYCMTNTKLLVVHNTTRLKSIT